MEAISGMISGAIHAPSAAAGGREPPEEVRRTGADGQDRPLRPTRDAYIPEEKREPSGRYWPDRGEDGTPQIRFDDPERADGGPETPDGPPDAPDREAGADSPKGRGAERCTGNTDQVDREIEKLKKERQELERRIALETDEAKIKDLERKLAQVERELEKKDNDTYRRQHTVFT